MAWIAIYLLRRDRVHFGSRQCPKPTCTVVGSAQGANPGGKRQAWLIKAWYYLLCPLVPSFLAETHAALSPSLCPLLLQKLQL